MEERLPLRQSYPMDTFTEMNMTAEMRAAKEHYENRNKEFVPLRNELELKNIARTAGSSAKNIEDARLLREAFDKK